MDPESKTNPNKNKLKQRNPASFANEAKNCWRKPDELTDEAELRQKQSRTNSLLKQSSSESKPAGGEEETTFAGTRTSQHR